MSGELPTTSLEAISTTMSEEMNLFSITFRTLNGKYAFHMSFTKRSLWSLGIFLVSVFVAWGFTQDYLLPIVNLPKLTPETTTWRNISFAVVPVLGFAITIVEIFALVSVFKPLKEYAEHGLVYKLVFWLRIYLGLGSVIFPSFILIFVIWYGLIAYAIIYPLITVLTGSLFLALLFGVSGGLKKEFRPSPTKQTGIV